MGCYSCEGSPSIPKAQNVLSRKEAIEFRNAKQGYTKTSTHVVGQVAAQMKAEIRGQKIAKLLE